VASYALGGATDITTVEFTYSATGYDPGSTFYMAVAWNDVAGGVGSASASSSSPSGTLTVTVNASITTIFCRAQIGKSGAVAQGTMTLSELVVRGENTNPWEPASATALARYGSGLTLSPAISIGTSPGSVGGFDTIGGGVSFGGADAQLKRATSIGGSYSNAGSALTAGDPILAIVPWNRRNSATSNFGQGSSTECIIGASALNASNEALWWLTSGGSMTNITPYDGSHYGIPVGPNCLIVHAGTHLAGIFLFNATRKFATSTNGGTSWTIQETVDSDTSFIIQPRTQRTARLLYYNYKGSGTGGTVSNDWGVTRVSKQLPITTTYIDVLS
jgi:hypothetical protein